MIIILSPAKTLDFGRILQGHKPKKGSLKVITPVFKEHRSGEYRIFSMHGKKEIGMMAGILSKKV